MPVRVAAIGGSGLYGLKALKNASTEAVETPYGATSADLMLGTLGTVRVAFLARHGRGHAIPPHRINHRANLWALKEMGVRKVLGTSSVGSLKADLKPGTLVVPDDFLSLWQVPTFHDDKVVHATPALDEGIRKAALAAAKAAKVRVRDGVVYAETRGPRLETRAEIRMLRDYADVVGMTMASECTLATELGLAYASLCSVDNLAHGVAKTPLTYQDIRKAARSNAKVVASLLPDILARMAGKA